METFCQDVKFGARMLAKNPGFTAVAVLTLALGIGANTAIFSVVNAVLLRPLPYDHPDELVLLYETQLQKGWTTFTVAPGNYHDWSAQNQAFTSMASFRNVNFNLSASGSPERVSGARVSWEFFSVLGVAPQIGRTFTADEDQPGRDRVVVISDGFWKRRLGADPHVAGSKIMLNAEPHVVLGVMPTGISIPGRAEVWAPAAFTPGEKQSRASHFITVLARRKPGVSIEKAQAEMSRIAGELSRQFPDSNKGWDVSVRSLMDVVVGPVERGLYVALGAVGFVLLIACVNVANLLLARASVRQREFAVRIAMGASRGRLARQLLTECAMLTLLAAGLGVLLALWGVDLLRATSPTALPRIAQVPVDWRVLLFTLGACSTSTLLFGIAPVVQLKRLERSEALKETAHAVTESRAKNCFRGALAVLEVSLSVVLLIGAGLLLKSLLRLTDVQPGFETDSRLTGMVLLPQAKYDTGDKRRIFFEQLEERLQSLPGVKAETLVAFLPLQGADWILAFGTPEMEASLRSSDMPSANYVLAGPGYFRSMGIRLLLGREFTAQDGPEAQRVMIINDVLARKIFPNDNPVGKRLKIANGPNPPWREIVGVVSEVKIYGLTDQPMMQMYEPYRQAPHDAMSVVLHTEGDPLNYSTALRAQVESLDKEQPVAFVQSLEQVLSSSLAQPRFRATLLGVFAGLALLMAAAGLYGVMAYSVAQRTHEIGLRIALGAQPRDVLSMVFGKGLALILAGVVIGLVASAGLTQFMRKLLFGVETLDSVTYATVAMVMLLTGFLACFVPARRAASVDPMVALRYE